MRDDKVVACKRGRRYRAEAIPLRNSQERRTQLRVQGGYEKGGVRKKDPVYICNTTITNIGINKQGAFVIYMMKTLKLLEDLKTRLDFPPQNYTTGPKGG